MELVVKENNGKIFSHIRKKWLIKTPEEIVRQNYLLILVNQYGYSLDQIDEELEITGRGSGGARADFVIWKSPEEKHKKKSPLIIVECKADYITIKEKDVFQGELYARQTNAPFFVTYNNNGAKYWRVIKDRVPGFRQEIEDIPRVNSSEKEIEELLNRLKVFKENEFADLLHQCHNIIRNREKLDPAAAFDEIAKVLFMKVYAERNLKSNMKGNIFTLDYIEEAEKYAKDYLLKTFEDTKREFGKDKIFSKDEKINLRVSTIKSIVEKLEKYNLSATSTDVKGIAFEKFLGKTFRGEIGQFFTPRKIVEFMVNMVFPKEGDIICDPASGSGGFLIRFFELEREKIGVSITEEYNKIKEKIEKRKDLTQDEKAKELLKHYTRFQQELDVKNQNSRIWKLSNRCIYGVDANDRMARTSKMNMIMHGDGHGGIHHHDGFLNVNGVFDGRFDIVLTNPPFGQVVEKEDEILSSQIEVDDEMIDYYKKVYGKAYEESQDKIRINKGKPITTLFELPKNNSIKTELLFIERCLSLLKPGGRLGIVLPEGVFNNPSLAFVREFAEDRAYINAIVSLPQETFTSSGASVKASILFMTKFNVAEKEKWDNLIKSYCGELLLEQVNDRKSIDLILIDKNSSKETKKEAKEKLKSLEKFVIKEARKKAKQEFNYPIFMCETEHVGITATGDEDVDELPEVLEQYYKFIKDPVGFIQKLEESEAI